MKQLINIVLIFVLVTCLFACEKNEGTTNSIQNANVEETIDVINQTLDADFNVEIDEIENGKTLVFSRMLTDVEDLKKLDITDEYQSACAVVFTLARFEEDFSKGEEMLEYINGPEDVSKFDIDFIKNQIDQYPYVVRSYFNNTSLEDNYTIKEVSITVLENTYSRDEEGYVKLWLHSSGADSNRSVMLRQKESTKEWFLFSDTYKGLMAGIRIPAENDKWS